MTLIVMLTLLIAGQVGQSAVVQGGTPNTLRLVDGAPRPTLSGDAAGRRDP